MSSIDENVKQVRPTLHMMEKTEFSPRIAPGFCPALLQLSNMSHKS